MARKLMNVLITGGAGYLGGYLSKALISENNVRILDLQETKYIPNSAEFVRGDIRDNFLVDKALIDIDVVFHLAFVQTPSKLKPEIQEDININGTRNILSLSVNRRVKKFIFVSTIELYGIQKEIPIKETASIDPISIYAYHKYICEGICFDYYKKHNLAVTIARLPMICGQGYYNHKAFLSIIDRIIDNKVILIPSPGSILADMIHIEDAIQALKLLLMKDEAIGEIFHFSASHPGSHLELINESAHELKSKSKIILVPPQIFRSILLLLHSLKILNFPRKQVDYLSNDYVLDNEKAIELLGYNAKYNAVSAIKELVSGYSRDRTFIHNRKIEEFMNPRSIK